MSDEMLINVRLMVSFFMRHSSFAFQSYIFFNCLVGGLSMVICTHAVLGVL